eukprot:2569420-Prymnesium_polylepis.1
MGVDKRTGKDSAACCTRSRICRPDEALVEPFEGHTTCHRAIAHKSTPATADTGVASRLLPTAARRRTWWDQERVPFRLRSQDPR